MRVSGLLLPPLLLLLLGIFLTEGAELEETGNATEEIDEDAVTFTTEAPDASALLMLNDQEKTDRVIIADLQSEAQNTRNVTFANETSNSVFLPSFHLGPIGAYPGTVIELPIRNSSSNGQEDTKAPANSNPRTPVNFPFNNVRTIKFEDDINGQMNKQQQQQQQQQQSPNRPSDKVENFVKFVEQTMQQYQQNFGDRSKNQNYKDSNQRHSIPPTSDTPALVDHQEYHHHHQHYQHHVASPYGIPDESYGNERPEFVTTYWTTPSTTNGYPVHHHHPSMMISNDNHYPPGYTEPTYHHYPQTPTESHPPYYPTKPSHYSPHYHQPDDQHHQPHVHLPHQPHEEKPAPSHETLINVHPISFQSTTLEGTSHPKTIIYVTTHEMPKGHSSHWPHVVHVDTPAVSSEHVEQHFPSIFNSNSVHEDRSVSPWRRILHIIGTFLPLGLLVALLSPRVIGSTNISGFGNDNSSNEPNIILSKLRVNDLPAEHKHGQLSALDTEHRAEACEERSICRLLAAADSMGYGFLRHLLLHVAERTSDSAVRKKELDKIFEAAKLGKCDILTCGFYDGI